MWPKVMITGDTVQPQVYMHFPTCLPLSVFRDSMQHLIEISDRCESIEPRTLRGLTYLWQLKSRAAELGYSDADIEAYADSRTEKQRIRTRGEAYVRARGLNPEIDRDLCKLGRRGIKKGSQIGALLKAK